MDRPQFELLYVHAHALAELAFVRSLARAMDAPVPELPPEQLADLSNAVDGALHATEADFNWDALAGLGQDDPAAGADAAPPGDAPPGPGFDEALAGVADPDADIAADPHGYLSTVYAARPALQPRLDHLWARADRPALEAMLADLPAQPEPLTGPLTADGWAAWLAAFEQHDPALETLVATLRAD